MTVSQIAKFSQDLKTAMDTLPIAEVTAFIASFIKKCKDDQELISIVNSIVASSGFVPAPVVDNAAETKPCVNGCITGSLKDVDFVELSTGDVTFVAELTRASIEKEKGHHDLDDNKRVKAYDALAVKATNHLFNRDTFILDKEITGSTQIIDKKCGFVKSSIIVLSKEDLETFDATQVTPEMLSMKKVFRAMINKSGQVFFKGVYVLVLNNTISTSQKLTVEDVISKLLASVTQNAK